MARKQILSKFSRSIVGFKIGFLFSPQLFLTNSYPLLMNYSSALRFSLRCRRTKFRYSKDFVTRPAATQATYDKAVHISKCLVNLRKQAEDFTD